MVSIICFCARRIIPGYFFFVFRKANKRDAIWATGGVEGAAVRGPAVEGAAWGYPGYPVLTRRGGSHFELETLGKGTLPLLTRETALGFLWA